MPEKSPTMEVGATSIMRTMAAERGDILKWKSLSLACSVQGHGKMRKLVNWQDWRERKKGLRENKSARWWIVDQASSLSLSLWQADVHREIIFSGLCNRKEKEREDGWHSSKNWSENKREHTVVITDHSSRRRIQNRLRFLTLERSYKRETKAVLCLWKLKSAHKHCTTKCMLRAMPV